MIKSMTGFASQKGASGPYSWVWELRSVNGRGSDLRLRVPDWIDGLEAGLRKKLGATVARGNVTCNLRLSREEGNGSLELNAPRLNVVLDALHEVELRAMDMGVSLAPSRAADIIGLRGVLEASAGDDDSAELAAVLLEDFETVLSDYDKMRAHEGAALMKVLEGQLNEMATLTDVAAEKAAARQDEMAATLRANLARVMEAADGVEPDRVAQELAIIAVKADITEEIDRLHTHITAARALLSEGGTVGRKLDFLMQEFNREANTLCSKAQNTALTQTGLALKAVIDQMREQVQNVE